MTKAAERIRKVVQVTLSDEARAILKNAAAEHPLRTASAVVEDLILGSVSATLKREVP
jgi:hypothetical protein